MTIPDISYHLIFCFLSLKELLLILQCCKQYKRLVYNPFFINMFKWEDQLKIKDEQQMELLSQSPFSKVVEDISIDDGNLNTSRFIVNFNRLQSLCLSKDMDYRIKQTFNISPIFQSIGPRLLDLNINLGNNLISSHLLIPPELPPSIRYLKESLSLLTSLTSLSLTTYNQRIIFTDVSFLSRMNQLKTLQCDCISKHVSSIHLVNNLICCVNLTRLNLCLYTDLSLLRELCTRLHNSKLEHIGRFESTTIRFKQYECSQLLNNLKNLKSIGMIFISGADISDIPILLGKWIQVLRIYRKILREEDVINITKLLNLKSLHLHLCEFESTMMTALSWSLSSKLERLVLDRHSYINGGKQLFQSLSKFYKLKTLILQKIDFNIQELFYLFHELTHIDSITLEKCKFYKIDIIGDSVIQRVLAWLFPTMIKKVMFKQTETSIYGK
jgi:hypothetical protein